MNPSRLSFTVAVFLFLTVSCGALAAPADDEFGARFSGKAPAALGDSPDVFADFLAGFEPAAGGMIALPESEDPQTSSRRKTYKPGPNGGYRAPRLTEDNTRYLVRKRSGE